MARINHLFTSKTGESLRGVLNIFQAAVAASDEHFDGKTNNAIPPVDHTLGIQESLAP